MRRRPLGGVLATVTLAAVLTIPPDARAQQSTPAPLEPASGALLGAYSKPETGWGMDDVKAAIASVETGIGRTLDIDHQFYGWGKTFPTWQQPWDFDRGRIPLLTWG
ncbi:MAG: hypothetical protein M3135_05180, partial [Actinomycetota bacterium]|nr:hypothetical protein [Actinomycetota bacterium]